MPPQVSTHYEHAEDFIKSIATFAEINSKAPREWIFRGHGCASYKLLPSALRATKVRLLSASTSEWESGIRETAWEQVTDEVFTLSEFFRDVDATGLSVPEDSQEIRASLSEILSKTEEIIEHWRDGSWQWPPRRLLSLVGMAQHYGMHTRLLDWSYDPLVATYFAAREGAERFSNEPVKEDIVVWCLARRALAFAKVVDDAGVSQTTGLSRIEIISAPAAWNPNLKAQKGLFTLLRSEGEDPDAAPDVQLLDDYISSRYADSDQPLLAELRLPMAEAGNVLRLLAYRFVTASTVFPGYDGSAKALKERVYWG